jgi:hypothetical protein
MIFQWLVHLFGDELLCQIAQFERILAQFWRS